MIALLRLSTFDADGNGQVSLAEFAAFSRGAAHSAAYHGEMAVFQQRGGDTSDAAEASSAPPLSGPLLYNSKEELGENALLKDMPHLSDAAGGHDITGGTKLDAAHLVLWRLSQHT